MNIPQWNHGFSHLRYSEVGFDRFVYDIRKGLTLFDSLASLHGKSLDSFRFPSSETCSILQKARGSRN